MTHSELWQMSAVDLSHEIKASNVSAREATEANIARMHAVNPGLNAVVNDLSESAIADAAALDEEFSQIGRAHV